MLVDDDATKSADFVRKPERVGDAQLQFSGPGRRWVMDLEILTGGRGYPTHGEPQGNRHPSNVLQAHWQEHSITYV